MIPRIIHQIWLGDKPIPEDQSRYIQGWRDKHPDWQYVLWTDANLPQMQNRALFDASDNCGWRSDILRYEILQQIGGVYVDTDFECLKNIAPLVACANMVLGGTFPNQPMGGIGVENAFLAAAQGHPFIKVVIRLMAERFEKSGPPTSIGDVIYWSGPGMLTEAITLYRSAPMNLTDDVFIAPSRCLYPVCIHQHQREPFDARWFSESFGIHHWKGQWNAGLK